MASYMSQLRGIATNPSLLGAASRVGLNALGGAMAAYARSFFAQSLPAVRNAGTLGVLAVAMGLHAYAYNPTRAGTWNGVIREIAAGMGGFVGQDALLIVRMWIGWGKWDGKKAYKKGDTVLYENAYYRATADIPQSNVITDPSKDDKWAKVVIAQGLEPEEWYDFAQALMSNDALLDGIVKEQLVIFGPELAQCVGRDLNQTEANHIYSGMRDSLKSVVQRYGQA